VRSSEFWGLVDGEFGPAYGRTLVRDHVVAGLGHRTCERAIADGEPLRTVWQALCDEMDVPPSRRWGQEEPAGPRRPRRRS